MTTTAFEHSASPQPKAPPLGHNTEFGCRIYVHEIEGQLKFAVNIGPEGDTTFDTLNIRAVAERVYGTPTKINLEAVLPQDNGPRLLVIVPFSEEIGQLSVQEIKTISGQDFTNHDVAQPLKDTDQIKAVDFKKGASIDFCITGNLVSTLHHFGSQPSNFTCDNHFAFIRDIVANSAHLPPLSPTEEKPSVEP